MVIDYMFLIVGGFAAFLVAWVNGANNAANAIGSAVGSGMMSIRKALWFTALFDLLGALFFGKFVSITLLRGIVNISIIDDPLIVVIGMITALFSTGLWLIITTLLKIPMSISQAIVGAILGFGLVTVGFSQINWSKVFEIIASWIYLPFVSIVLSIILYRIHSRIVSKPSYLRFIIVYNVFTTCILFTTIFLLLVKTTRITDVFYAFTLSIIISISISLLSTAIIHRILPKNIDYAREFVFKTLLFFSCMAMAFSHGANDVANSAGPLAGIIYIYEQGRIPGDLVDIPFTAILLSGIGISLGIIMWGYRVVETIGEKITTLTIETGFIAQFSGSLTILIVTRLGLPVSTTVAIVGAITGVGLARGVRSINTKTIFKIITMWFIGFPAVAGLTALLTFIGIELIK